MFCLKKKKQKQLVKETSLISLLMVNPSLTISNNHSIINILFTYHEIYLNFKKNR